MNNPLVLEIPQLQVKFLKQNAKFINPILLEPSSGIKLEGIDIIPRGSISNKPAAILIHGYTSNYRRLIYIANLLVKKGFMVILFNLRGHGKSSGKQRDALGMQQDLTQVIDYVKKKANIDSTRILVLGISLGAMLSLTSGYINPDITYIIALAGMSSPEDVINGMSSFRRWRWRIISKLGGLSLTEMTGKIHFSPKMQMDIHSIKKKILLLHCKNDRLISQKNFWNNIKAFHLNKDDFHLFSRGGHGFFLVKKEVLQTISIWIDKNIIYNAE